MTLLIKTEYIFNYSQCESFYPFIHISGLENSVRKITGTNNIVKSFVVLVCKGREWKSYLMLYFKVQCSVEGSWPWGSMKEYKKKILCTLKVWRSRLTSFNAQTHVHPVQSSTIPSFMDCCNNLKATKKFSMLSLIRLTALNRHRSAVSQQMIGTFSASKAGRGEERQTCS